MLSALKLPQAATSADGLTLGLAGNSWLIPANRPCASSVVIHSTRALAASGCGACLVRPIPERLTCTPRSAWFGQKIFTRRSGFSLCRRP
ncbi:hypothetical protein FQZ97_1117530 [compost metagenome]